MQATNKIGRFEQLKRFPNKISEKNGNCFE